MKQNWNEVNYLNLLGLILQRGQQLGEKENRTDVKTVGIFGTQTRYNLSGGQVPLLTTKAIHLKSVVHELLWFLSGDTNVKYLQDNGVRIWNEWADENGNLGRVYGAQWRKWQGDDPEGFDNPVDQIKQVLKDLKENPFSRRHIVTAWNPSEIKDMALPPCHCLFQFYVEELNGKKVLSCQLYQRSADMFLGVPFNIASYAILTHLFAHCLGYEAGEFIHTIGDAHIYVNHFDQVNEQLLRPVAAEAPKLKIDTDNRDIFGFKFEDLKFLNYDPLPAIKAEVAV